ncbi:MAG: polysaccharide deacetylase family protein, partial [Anaerolineae bacterium]|jgi:hypothetical protein
MCQASLAAYADLVDFGLVSAASTMVPCAWFPATAAFCRDNAQRVDMGVHTTLTSEWDGYRWGPISTRDPVSGLLDGEGYFYRSEEEAQEFGQPEAVQREIEAQVERALAEGIDVTHVDTHMGTVFHPQFLGSYVGTALSHGLPPFLLRKSRAELQEMGVDAESAAMFEEMLRTFEAQGVPLLDEICMLPLDQPEDRATQVKGFLETLPAGITYMLIHPAQDGPELRAITPDWPSRVADYEAFSSEEVRGTFRSAGIQVLGWRALRDLMRAG